MLTGPAIYGKPVSINVVNLLKKMAERAGFEPAVGG